MKQALLLLTVCLALFACKKHTSSPKIDWPCDIILDSASIANGIVGTWDWTKYVGGDGKVVEADKNITVTFTSSATFKVMQDGTVITQGTWKLQGPNSDQWEIILSTPSNYVSGWVGVCENQIAFFDGYADGPDNYFEEAK